MAFIGCLILLSVTAVSVFVYDYWQLKRSLLSKHTLEQEVTAQRTQMYTFAKRINSLTSDMIAMREFEKKIRVIADVEESAGRDAIFGIGGPTPEDLDASIPLIEKHNNLLRKMHAQVEDLQQASAIQKEALGISMHICRPVKSLYLRQHRLSGRLRGGYPRGLATVCPLSQVGKSFTRGWTLPQRWVLPWLHLRTVLSHS